MKNLFSTASLALVLVSSLALAGCEDKSKAKATTGEAAAPAAAVAANATSYAFSGADSKISFVGAKAVGKHDGSFGTFTGTVKIPGTDVEKGSVSASIDTGSVTADDAKLTGHLKSPDFFDVAKFPKATFESTSVKKAGDAYTITGNFSLHGVTKSISFPAKIAVAGDTVTVDADFKINRKDFNIVYPGMPDNLIKDDVELKLAIKAKKSLASHSLRKQKAPRTSRFWGLSRVSGARRVGVLGYAAIDRSLRSLREGAAHLVGRHRDAVGLGVAFAAVPLSVAGADADEVADGRAFRRSRRAHAGAHFAAQIVCREATQLRRSALLARRAGLRRLPLAHRHRADTDAVRRRGAVVAVELSVAPAGRRGIVAKRLARRRNGLAGARRLVAAGVVHGRERAVLALSAGGKVRPARLLRGAASTGRQNIDARGLGEARVLVGRSVAAADGGELLRAKRRAGRTDAELVRLPAHVAVRVVAELGVRADLTGFSAADGGLRLTRIARCRTRIDAGARLPREARVVVRNAVAATNRRELLRTEARDGDTGARQAAAVGKLAKLLAVAVRVARARDRAPTCALRGNGGAGSGS